MVEVQLNSDTKVPPEMLIAFAVCTTLLVAVHMLALMISTCILPNIEAVCNLHSISLVHESPHERLHWYIEVAWAFSTLLGLLLFLLEIAILCWVKFYDFSQVAAWSACIVLIPVLIIFLAFAIHFYRSLVAHKYEVTVSGIRELELLKEQIESTDVEGRNGVNLLQTGITHVVWARPKAYRYDLNNPWNVIASGIEVRSWWISSGTVAGRVAAKRRRNKDNYFAATLNVPTATAFCA